MSDSYDSMPAAPSVTVRNRGRCGQNSGILRERFDEDVLASPKPDHLLIYIGMNDAINDRFFTPIDDYCAHVAWMLTRACEAGIRPVVCTIHRVVEELVYQHHPRHHFGAETVNDKIARFNGALLKLAAELVIPVADFAAIADARPASDMLSDGVHLTTAGNALLARTFHLAMSPPLRGSDTIVCIGDSLTYGYGNQCAGSAQGDTYPAQLRELCRRSREIR